MSLEKVLSLAELEKKQKTIFKKGNKQIAIFKQEEAIFAIDNRCPHEGYPLLQGHTNDNCVLTCNWHNWKFDLKTGQCLTGGDNVKTYPIKIEDGNVFISITEPTKEEVQNEIMKGLKVGFEKRQYGRISRELARLYFNELDMLVALKKAIVWSYNKFEDGTNHAYAVAADWLKIYLDTNEKEKKITYLTEIIDYIALETLREENFDYIISKKSWNEEAFLTAVEKEDENTAIELINGAFDEGLHFKNLEKALTKIALKHYNDFGHSLIYVQKTNYLIEKLGVEVEKPLTLALVRSITKATKEDLLPEFKNYGSFLQQLEAKSSNDSLDFWLKNVQNSMKLVAENFSLSKVNTLYNEILKTNAKNMLFFDLSYQNNTDNKVSDNVGWLDFTHALTFSNAVKEQCEKFPELWKAGLLQMACFSGRNINYLDLNIKESDFYVENYAEFKNSFFEMISDHGITAPIYPAHLLKTSLAIFHDFEKTNDEELKKYLLATLKRFLSSPIKQKHMKRTIKQSIDLVSLDFN